MAETYTYWVRSSDTTNRTGSAISQYTYIVPFSSTLPTDVQQFEVTSFFRSGEQDAEPNSTIAVFGGIDAGNTCYNQALTSTDLLLHCICPTSLIGTSPDVADYQFSSTEVSHSNTIARPRSDRLTVTIRDINTFALVNPPAYLLCINLRPIRE